SNHPLNLLFRFVLEMAGLFAMGYWGWTEHDGLMRYVLAIGLPLLAAVLWGTFRIPNDPGPAPVTVPGPVRLLLEVVFFAAAVILLAAAGRTTAAIVFGALILFHYLISYDRVRWMLTGTNPPGPPLSSWRGE
ncbi:MAG: DUF2568 domain-containing protein, partial [Chloroflexi bacterium]